jgi:hypothetical protein
MEAPMPLSICRKCGRAIHADAPYCPSCGAINGVDENATEPLGWWFMAAANSAIVLFFVIALLRFMGF